MTTIKQPEPLIPVKEQGHANRLQDTGWGRAAAHLIPFYGLIYAVTRRTVTPALYIFGGSFIIGLGVGLANPNMTETQQKSTANAFALLATPVLAKFGIDQARKHAEETLK